MVKHRLILSIGLILIATTVVWLTPAPKSIARPQFQCVGNFQTAEHWGHGLNCSQASEDLYNQTFAAAEASCGSGNVCNPTTGSKCNAAGSSSSPNCQLVITLGCQEYPVGSGDYMIDGYMIHGCCDGGIMGM